METIKYSGNLKEGPERLKPIRSLDSSDVTFMVAEQRKKNLTEVWAQSFDGKTLFLPRLSCYHANVQTLTVKMTTTTNNVHHTHGKVHEIVIYAQRIYRQRE